MSYQHKQPGGYPRPAPRCITASTIAGQCRRVAAFPSGRCCACEEAAIQNQFAVIDSYIAEARRG